MREDFLELVTCPRCGASQFDLRVDERDDVEIRSATATCESCKTPYACRDGILDLLAAENEQISSERSGWSAMAGFVENTDQLMLSLPDPIVEPHRTDWKSQSDNFHYMWEQLGLTGNETVLDLGAGRCWSTRLFAKNGCRAVGLDVVLTKYVGLLTADVFIRNDGVYFDRLCADMNDIPLRDESFDLVFVTATLHHTSDPRRVLREVSRVLKPKGRLVMINEPVAGLPKTTKVQCVEKEHGINENIYRLPTYVRGLRAAGFRARLYPYVGSYNRLVGPLNMQLQRRVPPLRRWRMLPPLLYAQHLSSGGILNLVATKVRTRKRSIQSGLEAS